MVRVCVTFRCAFFHSLSSSVSVISWFQNSINTKIKLNLLISQKNNTKADLMYLVLFFSAVRLLTFNHIVWPSHTHTHTRTHLYTHVEWLYLESEQYSPKCGATLWKWSTQVFNNIIKYALNDRQVWIVFIQTGFKSLCAHCLLICPCRVVVRFVFRHQLNFEASLAGTEAQY